MSKGTVKSTNARALAKLRINADAGRTRPGRHVREDNDG